MAEDVETETKEVTTISEARPTKVTTTTKKVTPSIVSEPPHKVFQTKKALFRTYQFIWYILGFIEVLLIFRLALKALGANPLSTFTYLIYSASDPFALPFQGILNTTVAEEGAVLEWSTIFALFVYALFAYAIVQLLQFIKPVSQEEVEQTVDSQ